MTKILLVEDDKNLREIYGTRLSAEGYTIVAAGDGEEALALAIKERPNLIISDVMMPKISGFDMLDILRSTTETKDIRVIMMTALSSEDQRQRGESLGADRYLVKSQVGIEDVVRTVHEVLADGSAPATATPAPVDTAAPEPAPIADVAPQPVPIPAPLSVPPRQAQPSAIPEPVQFSTPAPAPVAPLQTPVVPEPAPVAAAPQFATAPVPPAPAPDPTFAPTQPATPVAPVAQAPTPTFAPAAAPADVQLPQPTAPFSTPRPLGLGDRIIQPLPSEENPTDNSIADRIEAALGSFPASEELATPPAVPFTTPVSPLPPAPSLPPVPPAVPSAPELSFEETPRASSPQQPAL